MKLCDFIKLLTFPDCTIIRVMNGETQYFYGYSANLESDIILNKIVDCFYPEGPDLIYIIVR